METELNQESLSETGQLDIVSLEELDPTKIYHIKVKPPFDNKILQSLAATINRLGLKALVTADNVDFEELRKLFAQMTDEQQAIIRATLA